MLIRPYRPDVAEVWDAFVRTGPQATFLHTRRFLSYHQDRFADASLGAYDAAGNLRAVFPAAWSREQAGLIVSHPGATYGGLICAPEVGAVETLEILSAAFDHWRRAAGRHVIYKAVPWIYSRKPAQEDLWALSTLGAERVRVDLSLAIDLRAPSSISARRARAHRKARAARVEVKAGPSWLPALWPVLTEALMQRHAVDPVHSLAQIELLAARFPDEIEVLVGVMDGRIEGGIVLFHAGPVAHVQYTAASNTARRACLLDAVILQAIESSSRRGSRWFDFGIATESAGKTLNDGLYSYKRGFGAGGVLYEHFQVQL